MGLRQIRLPEDYRPLPHSDHGFCCDPFLREEHRGPPYRRVAVRPSVGSLPGPLFATLAHARS